MKSAPKQKGKLLAYSVQGDECGAIVFAHSAIEARRVGASMINLEFNEVESCRRAAFADQYSEQGFVPIPVLLAQGWWWSCEGCGDAVKGTEVERTPSDNGDPVYKLPEAAIITDKTVWCSLQCKSREEAKQATEALLKKTITDIVLSTWPHAGSIHVSLATDPPQAHFMFPGGKHPATWAYGAESVRVAACDVAFWNAYVETKNAQKAEGKAE